MSMSMAPHLIATDVLNRLGTALDDRAWDAWLELYREDAVYWVPAWRDEDHETSAPDREISQIYHDRRAGLEERISRVRSGQSVTALPLPRTTHFTSNVAAPAATDDADTIHARASSMVHVYQPRTGSQYVNFGYYELLLARVNDTWQIARHVIHLKNDCVPALIDFYTL
jgi:benzoate/toluate 1,2-dioxygenase beta subunit/2,4,5-trichlorophenoxyacetic acid oxygenase 2